MKNPISLLFLFVTLPIKAQVFAPIGANWYYGESNGGAAPTNSEYIHYESIKDTTIKRQTVRKIVRTYYHYAGYTSLLNPLFVYDSGDTAFLYNPDKDNFGKLYIFNKHKGDTLTLDIPYGDGYSTLNKTVYRLTIDSIATETYNGKLIKKYKTKGLDNYQFWNNGWFMDYTGGLDWFFPRGMMIPEAGGPLRCYNDNTFSVNFTLQACDYRLISSVPEIDNEEVSIYPNPMVDHFQFISPKRIIQFEIFDNLGVLRLKGNKEENDISPLETGIYMVKIQLQNKKIIYRKILKY